MLMESTIDPTLLKAEIKRLALDHDFPLVGIASAEPFVEAERVLVERIEAGLLSGLAWFIADRARFCCAARHHLPDAMSLICLGVSYNAPEPIDSNPNPGPHGRDARYAWGRDYHREHGRELKSF